jgi:S1-C subfamily serine protease
MRALPAFVTIEAMTNSTLSNLSNDLAALIDGIAPSVVQVQGRRRSASGVAIGDDRVVTMVRTIGREDRLTVKRPDGHTVDAELAGWDPATGIAVLQSPGLNLPAAKPAEDTPRVGHLAVAVARSWSNVVTASVGTIAIIGGPLPTGHRRSIEQVFRTTAPMHDGFAGGAFVGASGNVIGITTAAAIRGLGVVIPAPIVWRAASEVLKHGRPRRGYLGIAGQPVELTERQRAGAGRDRGLLIVGITAGAPADAAGLLVGDVLVDFDGQPVSSPEDLLDLLTADRVGRSISARLLRGGTVHAADVSVTERTA